jgi:hypothetical protein
VRETYSHATRIAQEAVNSSAEEVREAERKVQRAAR